MYLIVASITWLFPLKIASEVIPQKDSDVKEQSQVKTIELAQVGCGLMALYIIINNIWSLIPALILFNQRYEVDPSAIMTSVFMLVTGVLLFVNNHKLAQLMCK